MYERYLHALKTLIELKSYTKEEGLPRPLTKNFAKVTGTHTHHHPPSTRTLHLAAKPTNKWDKHDNAILIACPIKTRTKPKPNPNKSSSLTHTSPSAAPEQSSLTSPAHAHIAVIIAWYKRDNACTRLSCFSDPHACVKTSRHSLQLSLSLVFSLSRHVDSHDSHDSLAFYSIDSLDSTDFYRPRILTHTISDHPQPSTTLNHHALS